MRTFPEMDSERSSRRALFVLLLASMVLVGLVIRPLAIALFLAVVLAGALAPVHLFLCRKLGQRRKLAAMLTVFLVVLVVIGPVFGISALLVKEASDAWKFISETLKSEGVEGLVSYLPDQVESWAHRAIDRVPLEETELVDAFKKHLAPQGGAAAAAVGSVLATTGSFIFQMAMMLIAFFFFLTQRDMVLRWVDEASPLRQGQTRELLGEFRKVTVAILRSSILTALVQAIAALVGYFIARVPQPLFFAGLTFFFALIPAVGGASVCILAALLMLLTGHHIAAIFLAAWGVIAVGLSDNVVKPLLIKGGKGGVQMNGVVVFFSLLGGLAAFGAIGLLVGPLAVALFVALLRIYRRDYGDEGPSPERRPTPEHSRESRTHRGPSRPRTV